MNEEEVINEIAVIVSGSTIDYTEQLTAISGKLDTINGFLIGIILFMGVVAGILFMTIMWHQFKD